jgi:hypothetical protein
MTNATSTMTEKNAEAVRLHTLEAAAEKNTGVDRINLYTGGTMYATTCPVCGCNTESLMDDGEKHCFPCWDAGQSDRDVETQKNLAIQDANSTHTPGRVGWCDRCQSYCHGDCSF